MVIFKLQFYPKSIFRRAPWKVLHLLFSPRTVPRPHPLGLGIYFGLYKSHMFSFDEVIRVFCFHALEHISSKKVGLTVICQGQRCGCCLLSVYKWDCHRLRPDLHSPKPHSRLPLGAPNPNPSLFSKSSPVPSSPRRVLRLRIHDSISLFCMIRESETLDFEFI